MPPGLKHSSARGENSTRIPQTADHMAAPEADVADSSQDMSYFQLDNEHTVSPSDSCEPKHLFLWSQRAYTQFSCL